MATATVVAEVSAKDAPPKDEDQGMGADGGLHVAEHSAKRKADDAELPAEPGGSVAGGLGSNLEEQLKGARAKVAATVVGQGQPYCGGAVT